MKSPDKPIKENKSRIDIKYQPLADLKTTQVTGAAANLTPDGLINIFFYTERRAYPVSTYVTITDKSSTEADDEFESGSGEALVREISHSIVIDPSTAQFIVDALEDAIGFLKNRRTKRVASDRASK